jgi:Tfp pilus assembly protein PilV
MNKGVSLLEVSVALLIITTSLIVFLDLATNYLRTVKNANELFVMNVLSYEGIELAIAWRNKAVEVPFSSSAVPPNINDRYCISFSGGLIWNGE